MELRLTFGYSDEDVFDSDTYGPQRLADLPAEATADLAAEARALDFSTTATIEPGSIGKGAAGPGFQLVLHIAETFLNDGASVFAWGTVLWGLVRKVQGRHRRSLEVQDPMTIGMLAAAAEAHFRDRIAGATMREPICLTGGGPNMGTDLRDVWLTPFLLPSGDVWALFCAPDGAVLGDVVVPARWTTDRGLVDGATMEPLFRALNPKMAGP